MAASPELRLPHIDGLRAVAVLGVVISHGGKYVLKLQPANPIYHALAEGAHGVDLFFVISGLCLAYPTFVRLQQSGSADFNIAGYAARRLVRIIPPFWLAFGLVLVAAIALLRLGYILPWPAVVLPSLGQGLRQLVFLNSPAPLGNTIVGSFWTLGVEFRWYFLFPILLWLWIRFRPAFFAAAAVSLYIYHFTPAKVIDFAALPAFMMGIIAADLAVRRHPLLRWAPLALVAAIAASLMLEPGHLRYAYQDQIWWQVACFALVLAACAEGTLRKVLSIRPIVAVGIASYSIYLMHDPPMAWYGLYGGHSVLVAIVVGVLAGFGFYLVWERWFVEEPSKGYLVKRVSGAVAKAAGGLGLRGKMLLRRSGLQRPSAVQNQAP